jgi:cyclohexyl-isocyanide hydratase
MTSTINIGLAMYPAFTQLDLTGPFEVFARLPGATVRALAATPEAVTSDSGLAILPHTTLDRAGELEVLCVPGGPGVNAMLEDDGFLSFLGRAARGARFVTSVCSGSLLLGAAGLLRGYRATSHWLSLDFLPLFGAIPVRERVVVDRDRITGGGVTAGIDFGLRVAAELCGEEAARRVQLMLEYDPQPPFDAGSPASARPDTVEAVRRQGAAYLDARREIARRAAERLERGGGAAPKSEALKQDG